MIGAELGLTPLQLAVNLGERDMVLAVLRKKQVILWTFGEMSMHKIRCRRSTRPKRAPTR